MNKLEEIKQALQAAKPGPWEYQEGGYGKQHVVYQPETNNAICLAKTHDGTKQDFEFIAKTPEYITYLLSLIEEKDKALAFYANEENYNKGYIRYDDDGEVIDIETYIEEDNGSLARKAMRGE